MLPRTASAVLGALLLLASAASAGDGHDDAYARLLEQKAGAVVSVKFVLHWNTGSGERESSATGTAVLVDPVGLLVMPTIGGGRMRDMKIVPSEFRVTFPGDPKEYPAILGASDSKIGLTFVRIKDLEGRQVTAVGSEPVVEPKVGDLLYGVSRLPQGFDYSPYCAEARITGKLTKPRELWNFEGPFSPVAHPLYTSSGAVAGIIVNQEGVGGGGSGTFLLPWKTFATTLERAKKASDEALEEAKKKEAEGGEKPAETPETPAEPKEGEKPAEPPAEGPDGKDGGGEAGGGEKKEGETR